jgi:hypothetical protein
MPVQPEVKSELALDEPPNEIDSRPFLQRLHCLESLHEVDSQAVVVVEVGGYQTRTMTACYSSNVSNEIILADRRTKDRYVRSFANVILNAALKPFRTFGIEIDYPVEFLISLRPNRRKAIELEQRNSVS